MTASYFVGFNVDQGSKLRNCVASYNFAIGFELGSDCEIEQCTACNNGTSGILAAGAGNRIDGNNLIANGTGIFTMGDNFIVRNHARGNTNNNYSAGAGAGVGTIQTTPVGAGAWDNFSF